jgi:hypothetical protein
MPRAREFGIVSNPTGKSVEEIALSTVFSAEHMQSLMEVVNATENPQVAIQLLLGIYQQPEIPPQVIGKNGEIKTFVNFNKFSNYVEYKALDITTKGMWFLKPVLDSMLEDGAYDFRNEIFYDDFKQRAFYEGSWLDDHLRDLNPGSDKAKELHSFTAFTTVEEMCKDLKDRDKLSSSDIRKIMDDHFVHIQVVKSVSEKERTSSEHLDYWLKCEPVKTRRTTDEDIYADGHL